MTVAKQSTEIAEELRRQIKAKLEVINARPVPFATLEEIGEIGLLEYQADRMEERVRYHSPKPWWRRFLNV